MYKAFEMKVKDVKLSIGSYTNATSRNIPDDLKKNLYSVIVDGQIIVDGQKVSDTVFPNFHSDVFISHSHNDKDIMYYIADRLTKELKLKVFADEFFWGSADELLREIDNRYCFDGYTQECTKIYRYKDRNLTTSHVHIMLSSAIMKAIDQCEMLLFLNTGNSVPNIGERFYKGRYTLSPWIYHELLFASMVQPKLIRKTDIKPPAQTILESPEVAYPIPAELKMIPLTMEDIDLWSEYAQSEPNRNALDCLYSMK